MGFIFLHLDTTLWHLYFLTNQKAKYKITSIHTIDHVMY